MPDAGTLRRQDLHAVDRLIGECCELGDDPYSWHTHMIEGLKPLTGLVGVTLGMDAGRMGTRPILPHTLAGYLDCGWPDARTRAQVLDYWRTGAVYTDPRFVPFLTMRDPVIVRRQFDLISERDWHRTMHFNEYYRPGGLDHQMITVMSPRPETGIGFYFVNFLRPLKGRPFSERGRQIVELFMGRVYELLGTELMPFGDSHPPGLSWRQRQVLALLLRGETQKEIAARLGLSPHTVHDYVRDLYTSLGVTNRAELAMAHGLSKSAATGGGFPGLSPRLQQVLALVWRGCAEDEIADELGLRPQSVHACLKQLYRRFRVHSRVELLFKCRIGPAQ